VFDASRKPQVQTILRHVRLLHELRRLLLSEMTEALHKFRSGPVVLAEALHGATPEETARIPAPGKWTINQLVRHVADTEIVVGMRLRLIIAEDRPTLSPFDQDKWAANLGYEKTNAITSMAVFQALRIDTTALLESLPPEAFDRVSVHPERGEKTLLEWVQIFGNHVYSHADQIRKIRAAL
jgi:hypothetical protein